MTKTKNRKGADHYVKQQLGVMNVKLRHKNDQIKALKHSYTLMRDNRNVLKQKHSDRLEQVRNARANLYEIIHPKQGDPPKMTKKLVGELNEILDILKL